MSGHTAESLRDRYASAPTLEEFVDRARTNVGLWKAVVRRAQVPADLLDRAADLPERRLLVLLEDWCGDAVNTIPFLGSLADAIPQLELRVLSRDANPDLMNSHLTGTSRSIPVVTVLDAEYRERGWWGPRPSELQRWVMSPAARAMASADRYKEIRRWYAHDRGRATLVEVIDLMRRTSRDDPGRETQSTNGHGPTTTPGRTPWWSSETRHAG